MNADARRSSPSPARLSGFLVLILASVLMLSGCGDQQLTEEEHLQKSREALLKQDYQTSLIEVKNALQMNPDNAGARFLLGQIYLDTGNADAALIEFEKARGLGFSPVTLAVPLGKAYLGAHRYDDLIALPAGSLNLNNYDKAYVSALKGYAYMSKQEVDKAQAAFASALQIQPNLAFAHLGKIRLLLAMRNLEGAKQEMARALEAHAGNASVQELAGDIALLEDLREEAEKHYSLGLDVAPDNFSLLNKRALVRLSMQKTDEVAADLQKMQALSADNPKTLYIQGTLHYANKEYAQAQQALEEVVGKDPDNRQSQFFLGATYLARNNMQQALYYLERFAEQSPNSLVAQKILIALYLKQREYQTAERQLDSLRGVVARDPELLAMAAQVAISNGDMDKALELLDKARSLDTNSTELQTNIGLALLHAGRVDDAIATLEQTAAANPDSETANNMLVMAYVRNGEQAKAIAHAQKMAALRPDSPAAPNLMGYVYAQAGEQEKAAAAFKEALVLAPGDPAANHNLALMAMANKDYDAARQHYRTALDKHPEHLPTLLRLASLEYQAENPGEGDKWLQKALQIAPNNVTARVNLARSQGNRGAVREAIELLDGAPPETHNHSAILAELAKLWIRNGETDPAVSALEKLAAEQPDQASIWFQLGTLYEGNGDAQNARKSFGQAMDRLKDDPLLGSNIARGLYRNGDKARSKQLFDRLSEKHPADANLRLLQAWFLQQEGKFAEAVNIYRKVTSEVPSTETMLALTNAEAKAGDLAGATRQLSDWFSDHPNDRLAGIALAQLYLDDSRTDQAIQTLETLLEQRRNDARLLNDAAWLLSDHDLARALKYARHAHELNSGSGTIMDTLGLLLLKNGDITESIGLLNQASSRSPENPSIRLHLAQALVAGNELPRAREELENTLAKHAFFAERKEAEALLDKLQGE